MGGLVDNVFRSTSSKDNFRVKKLYCIDNIEVVFILDCRPHGPCQFDNIAR
jgi:hypothetical protein